MSDLVRSSKWYISHEATKFAAYLQLRSSVWKYFTVHDVVNNWGSTWRKPFNQRKKKNILIVLFWHSSYCSLHLVLLRSFLCLMHHIFWTSIDDCLHAFELMWTLCAFLCQLHETYLLFTFHSIHLMLLYWMFLHCLWRHCIVQCLALINVTIKAGDGRW